jgi:hypothetical protein
MAETKLPITTATNQQYGMALAQQKAQQAVPMGPITCIRGATNTDRQYAPGSLTPLTAPTARPNEPITAGANFGPGTNAMGAGIMPAIEPADDVLNKLVYLNTMYPNSDLQNLISALRDGGQ